MTHGHGALLEDVIDKVIQRKTQSSQRLDALADFVRQQLDDLGLHGAVGGARGELRVKGLARTKRWDVAYEYAGKYRLLISLKSIWKNASGTVPNRLDDHMGEIANIQQLNPEVVIGYVVIFDVVADSKRKDGLLWSEFFEQALRKIAIRKAPLWNQGLLEGFWFIRVDSSQPKGSRVLNKDLVDAGGSRFLDALLSELRRREPAIPFNEPS